LPTPSTTTRPRPAAGNWRYYYALRLKDWKAGQILAAADPVASVRYVRALLEWLRHYEALAASVQAAMEGRIDRYVTPEWLEVWTPRSAAAEALRLLLRRKLPFDEGDIKRLLSWIVDFNADHGYRQFPVKSLALALERFADAGASCPDLAPLVFRFATIVREEYPGMAGRADQLERLGQKLASDQQEPERDPQSPMILPEASLPDAAVPAPAGSPGVLVQLKEFLGILPGQPDVQTEELEPDRFRLRSDSPLREEHRLISDVLADAIKQTRYLTPDLGRTKAGRQMLACDPATCGRLLLAAMERAVAGRFGSLNLDERPVWQSRYAAAGLVARLSEIEHSFDRNGLFDVLLVLSSMTATSVEYTENLIEQVERNGPLTQGERHVLYRLRCVLIGAPPLGCPGRRIERLTRLIGDAPVLAAVPGEAWADALNGALGRLPGPRRSLWLELLAHALCATGARPPTKWLKTVREKLRAVGEESFATVLLPLLPRVNERRSIPLHSDELGFGAHCDLNSILHEGNATLLRGLIWMVPLACNRDLARALTPLALSAYRKIPGVGPRATKIGNAAVYALSQIGDMEALGQLAVLKTRVKFSTAQKEIEKALSALAEKLAVPREDLEEMAVPAYGLEEVGLRRETFGDFTAELRVAGASEVTIAWLRADGKPQKSVPATVKRDFKDDLKDLQTAAKDIAQMLPAQVARIDAMFLQDKTWPLDVWRALSRSSAGRRPGSPADLEF